MNCDDCRVTMDKEQLVENAEAFVAAVVDAQPQAKSKGGRGNAGKKAGTSVVRSLCLAVSP